MSRRSAALAWNVCTSVWRNGAAELCAVVPAVSVARDTTQVLSDTTCSASVAGSQHQPTVIPRPAPSLQSQTQAGFRQSLQLASPASHLRALQTSLSQADGTLLSSPALAFPAPLPQHQVLRHHRCFTSSAATASGGDEPGGMGGVSGGGSVETRLSLGEALNQLVDAAIEKVEAGQMDEAVSLLKEGLNTFEPMFPNSPELGELHNQAALLLLFQGKTDEAAHHAQVSLETTKRHFGATSVLTAHRLLRLGVVRFAQGKLADAAGILREAHELLGSGSTAASDPGSRFEAGFYLDCVALAHVRDAGGVEAVGPSLRDNVKGLKEAYGGDSMILSLALSQHNRLVNGGLEQSDFAVGEALLKQHIALLTEVAGPDAEDVAVARYKLATYYYANDMLQDAGAAVRQAAVALRAHYPDEHDMLVLCKHRLGMICAAQGDHRAASQLLQASRTHFSNEGGQSMLAKEADIGLAMVKFRAVDTARETTTRRIELQQAALEQLRNEIEALGTAIGHGHMLVQGATRYYGQLSKLAR